MLYLLSLADGLKFASLPGMRRLFLLAGLIGSSPAWAVGEHLTVTGPGREQLSETLCISMECNAGGDYTVTSRLVAGKMELKVLGPSGPRLTLMVATSGDGRLVNSDAMTATSQLVQAIENPVVAKEAVTSKPAVKAKKSAKLAKASKAKVAKPVRVAARKLSRG